jgi:hypothetical protein
MVLDAYLHIFEEKSVKLRKKIREEESKPSPDINLIKNYIHEADRLEETCASVIKQKSYEAA